jgi:hypothetical protein
MLYATFAADHCNATTAYETLLGAADILCHRSVIQPSTMRACVKFLKTALRILPDYIVTQMEDVLIDKVVVLYLNVYFIRIRLYLWILRRHD